MTEIEQIKKYVEERLKTHREQADSLPDDALILGQIHEDITILREIEEITNPRDKIKSDN